MADANVDPLCSLIGACVVACILVIFVSDRVWIVVCGGLIAAGVAVVVVINAQHKYVNYESILAECAESRKRRKKCKVARKKHLIVEGALRGRIRVLP